MYKHLSQKSKLRRFLLSYGFHLLFLLFTVNLGISYIFHFYIIANSCMTIRQVQSDGRCLYIWGNQVYQKGDRSTPHQGHPCGTDITSVIPASHVGNQARYLLPNYVANVCPAATSTPIPTNTPTPTRKPTVTPTPKPTLTPIPPATATPRPQATPNLQATVVPTQMFVRSTATPAPVSQAIASTPIPTAASLTNTPVPTQEITDPILVMFIACFDSNSVSPNCINPQEVDFNHDGVIDGTDYNLYLLYKLNPSLTLALSPTPVSTITAVLSITPSSTIMPTVIVYTSPTDQPTIFPSSIPTQVVIATQPPLISPTLMPFPTAVPSSLIASLTNKVWLSRMLDWGMVMLLAGVLAFGLFRSKLFQKVKAGKPVPTAQISAQVQPAKSIVASEADELYDKTVLVSIDKPDLQHNGLWVKLTGDEGITSGYYKGTSLVQGFMRVKGTKKTKDGQSYIEITEVLPA